MASLPYPRCHQTIFPQNPQNPQKFLMQDILPQIADVHRLGGYGILPYPRRHQTIFPQNPQKFLTQDILPQIARMCTD